MSTKKKAVNPNPSIDNTKDSGPTVINGIKLSNEPDAGKTIIVQASLGKTGQSVELSYCNTKIIGNGSFGVVFQAKLNPNGEFAAVKKVLQDKRFKNRELQIMRVVSHPNIVGLYYYFYSNGEEKDDVFLNLVLEFVPENLYRASRTFAKVKQSMPMLFIKTYMYQLMRSIAYIHALGICHRDIKPQNLLIDPRLGILKLCDFGSAKILIEGEPNVSYICSRYYRAPELIFGSTTYNVSIDVWSCGCVMAELMLGQPLFPGETGVDQLVEIIKVMGTPSKEQIKSMNPNYSDYKFPQIKATAWSKVFRSRHTTPEALDLITKLLDYTPNNRPTAWESLTHPFFDELRLEDTKLPNGKDLPRLFNFSQFGIFYFYLELSIRPDLNKQLVPNHSKPELLSQGIDIDNFQPIEIVKLTTIGA